MKYFEEKNNSGFWLCDPKESKKKVNIWKNELITGFNLALIIGMRN